MFKLGLFPHGVVTPHVTLTPAPTFDGIYADSTLSYNGARYCYYAYQATSINVPINMSLISNLNGDIGKVYYQVTSSWSHGSGSIYSNVGPTSKVFGTFNIMPSAVPCPACVAEMPVDIILYPNQWIIIAVDGTVAASSTFSGEIINLSGNATYTITNSYYGLISNYMNPLTINPGPGYDSTNDPTIYYYSGTDKVTGLIPSGSSTDISIVISNALAWDAIAQLYYKIDIVAPAPGQGWSATDPSSIGYLPIGDGDKIFGVKNDDWVRFAVGGKVGAGSINVQIDIQNLGSQTIAIFDAFATVTLAP